MTTPALDAVIFDLGAVVVQWDPLPAWRGRWREAEIVEFMEEIDFGAFNFQQDAGRSWAQARAELAATHPHRVEFVDAYLDNFAATILGPVPGTAEVIADLKNAGLGVYGLTNWSRELYPIGARLTPAIALLADVLVSGEVGMAKPDLRIYQLAIERFGIDPARTAFVDDQSRNVLAAEQAGLIGVQFHDADQLRAALRDLGVRLTDTSQMEQA